MKISYVFGILVIIGSLVYTFWTNGNRFVQVDASDENLSIAIAKVTSPEKFSPNAIVGKLAYDTKCVTCHGTNAEGKDGLAPPLVHKIYEPSHHGDESFQRAVSLGVKAHHWRFGNMPPVEGLTRGDVKMIIAYIRELQRANGIN